ncbi:hypothetical protein ACFX58_19385 [Sphingomonas sp. NCPPB 2930]
MKRHILLILALAGIVFSPMPATSGALFSFSRACNMSNIPDIPLWVALQFFSTIGMPARYLDIYSMTPQQRKNYWVFESFTAEIPNSIDTRPKFYIFAENRVYRAPGATVGGSTPVRTLIKTAKSKFASEKVDSAVFADSTLSIIRSRHLSDHPYFGGSAFARAGYANVVDYDSDPAATYQVDGKHWWKEASTGIMGNLADSFASDCNSPNTSSGKFDWGIF